jgi:3-phosphoshikimate 1-carboxyvinyltransferase
MLRVHGEIFLPGDKSISHRALILSSLSKRPTRLQNLPGGLDLQATLECLRACGLSWEGKIPNLILSTAKLREPQLELDCLNSGTTVRLLTGFLAGQGFSAKLTGDESLSRRPMARIIRPLEAMGAEIKSREGHLPIVLRNQPLMGIDHCLEVPSAQVKSALLLAGLGAVGQTTVRDPFGTRNHTERLFQFLGIDLEVEGEQVCLRGPQQKGLQGFELKIPGDLSSAAYFIAAAVLLPGSDLILRDLVLNPTRTGFLRVLERMGARVEILSQGFSGNEEIGDLRVRFSPLSAIKLEPLEQVSAIDEIPMLAVLATQAEGVTRLENLKELRYKESDRLKAIVINLRRMGARVYEEGNDLIISGPARLHGAKITTFSDHRIAMAFSIAALIAEGATPLDDPQSVAISFPEFYQTLKTILL